MRARAGIDFQPGTISNPEQMWGAAGPSATRDRRSEVRGRVSVIGCRNLIPTCDLRPLISDLGFMPGLELAHFPLPWLGAAGLALQPGCAAAADIACKEIVAGEAVLAVGGSKRRDCPP